MSSPFRFDDVVGLRALVAVAEYASFRRAAEALGISQPALSRQLQRLERGLGLTLVRRGPGAVGLTPAGERLRGHARQILTALDEAARDVRAAHEAVGGSVRLGTLVSVGDYFLPRPLVDFRRAHPAVHVTVQEGLSAALESLLDAGQLDLAIIKGPVHRDHLVATTLWREDFVLVVPAGHALAQRTSPVTLDELLREPVALLEDSPGRPALEAAGARHKGAAPCIVLETDNISSLKQMVRDGACLAMVPAMVATVGEPWPGARVPLAAGAVQRHVMLLHRGTSTLSAAARALRDLVVRACRHDEQRA